MTLKTLVAAAVVVLVSATSSFAIPVNFDFSFTNGTNTVSGVVEGLDSNGLNQTASRITVSGVLYNYVFTSFTFTFNDFAVSSSTILPTSNVLANLSTANPSAFLTLNLSTNTFLLQEIGAAATGTAAAFARTAANVLTMSPVAAVPLQLAACFFCPG